MRFPALPALLSLLFALGTPLALAAAAGATEAPTVVTTADLIVSVGEPKPLLRIARCAMPWHGAAADR